MTGFEVVLAALIAVAIVWWIGCALAHWIETGLFRGGHRG